MGIETAVILKILDLAFAITEGLQRYNAAATRMNDLRERLASGALDAAGLEREVDALQASVEAKAQRFREGIR